MKVAMDEIVASTNSLAVGDDDVNVTNEEALAMDAVTDANQSQCEEPQNSEQISNNQEFVNTGLHRWEEIRSDWLSSCKSAASSTSSLNSKNHAKQIDVDDVIDLIVSNRWRQQPPPPPSRGTCSSTSSLDTARSATKRRDDACFASPVSLPQMVDVLVDLWEAEGLDI
ncbi:hypothetical protein HJC23_007939 [Cyclotella cryptica]|uniref:Gag1-like clamp domain-containing protein n=1 Tax=Cyclotella cryptica TaxID=29204 RepID=A0ABD3PA80_9STRA|eukprot:CCRYP_016201-RA/>CCRYP_016201-RA protein AED:0.39 eAED:0.39 QI:0/-1/0/1/-1/1/1/0/168